MKILIVTAMFPPNRTGTSFYSKNLADAFVKRGNEVRVVTTKNSDADATEKYDFKLFRIPALHIPLKNYFKHLRFCSLNPGSYKALNHITKEFQPDVMLLVNHYLDIAFPAIHAARKNNIPLYISVGTQLQSARPFRNSILKFMDRLIVGGLIFPRAKHIISWDKEIERYIKNVQSQRNASKSVIIPFGVNGDITEYEAEQDYSQDKQILGVGAIIDQRDYCFQIKVFQELLKTFPDLKLKIIGHQYIQKPIELTKILDLQDKIEFTGEIPHEEVLNSYRSSALHWMMLNGEYVGLGTSTIEAMLMGVPVVSNIPENLFGEKLLHDMGNYIYSDGKDIKSSAEKLIPILKDQSTRQKIGSNGRKFVEEYMNWDKVAEKYELLFKKKN